jgi:ABC-2 type transport system ATP-binding protein
MYGETMGRATAGRLRARVGFLTESPGLWDRLTVAQNLQVYARLHGLRPAESAVDAALDAFDVRDRANERTAQLSKGLRQRVALARTLLHDPAIVLLDEPTSGLDPESARRVRALILRLRDERRAVLLSTHNLDEVERVANRVAVLRTRLVAVDTPAALRARLFGVRLRVVVARDADQHARTIRDMGVIDVHVDGSDISFGIHDRATSVPEIVGRLVAAGAEIEAVIPEEPPLEEVYLKLLEGDAAGES